MRGKVGFPRLRSRSGAPSAWLYMESPRRTFASDSGDVSDLTRTSPAAVRGATCTWTNGPRGPCLGFDGSSTGIATLTTTLTGPPITIATRFRAASVGAFIPILISRSGTAYAGLNFSNASGNPVAAQWGNSSAEQNAATGLFATPGRWYFAAAVITTTSSTTYLGDMVTGVLSSYTLALSNPQRSPTTILLGGDANSSSLRLNGNIDGLPIWPRALSPQEVAREFDDPDWRLRRPGRQLLPAWAGASTSFRSFFFARDLSGGLSQ